jgi:hypothetical protein
VRVKIDGRICVDRPEFAKLLGIKVHSSFDQRRRRDVRAGLPFPSEYTRLHGHPYWLLVDAEHYASTRVDQRTKAGTRLRPKREPEPISA